MAKRKSLSLQKNDQLSGTFQVIGKAIFPYEFLERCGNMALSMPFLTWKAPESCIFGKMKVDYQSLYSY